MALCFCCIQDSWQANTAKITPGIKAIHVEVDNKTSSLQLESIKKIYSSTGQNFPLGIKMRLVPKFQTLTNLAAYNKAIQLQTCQAKFLEMTETYQIWEDILNHPHNPPLYNTLREMKLAHWSAIKMAQPLFHALAR